jgi:hypothetical protein
MNLTHAAPHKTHAALADFKINGTFHRLVIPLTHGLLHVQITVHAGLTIASEAAPVVHEIAVGEV